VEKHEKFVVCDAVGFVRGHLIGDLQLQGYSELLVARIRYLDRITSIDRLVKLLHFLNHSPLRGIFRNFSSFCLEMGNKYQNATDARRYFWVD